MTREQVRKKQTAHCEPERAPHPVPSPGGRGRALGAVSGGGDRRLRSRRRSIEEIIAAVDCINSNYELHCRAAAEIAREFFNYDVVLTRLLADAGL